MRACFDKASLEHVSISACVTGDPSKINALPFSIMARVLETINIMTYDFASSSFGPCQSSHQTNIYSTSISPLSIDKIVQAFLARGIPREKIVIGATLYSRGFANTDGLGCPSHGIVADKSWEDGVVDYKQLPKSGREFYDAEACGWYSYDPHSRILNSYDSIKSVQDKCKFVWENDLKGIIVWESSADHPVSDPRSIIGALYRGLALKKY